nr:translational initiation factor 1 [Cuphea hookeriana]UPY85880.1 translational initiation factor 1 [Cuphea hookeriana]
MFAFHLAHEDLIHLILGYVSGRIHGVLV